MKIKLHNACEFGDGIFNVPILGIWRVENCYVLDILGIGIEACFGEDN